VDIINKGDATSNVPHKKLRELLGITVFTLNTVTSNQDNT
jgi:hypothetical protein